MTVVCGAHFVETDFALDISACWNGDKPKRRRLKGDVVPTVFSFREARFHRPSPLQRRETAGLRAAEIKRLAVLPKFGPLTKAETLEKELEN